MRPFNHPPPGFVFGILLFGFLLLSYLTDVGFVSLLSHEGCGLRSRIGFVRAEMRLPPPFPRGPFDENAFEGFLKQLHIMPVGSAHDEGQRDSIVVYQQTSFAAFFFRGP